MLLKLTKPKVIALIFTILALGVVGSPETWKGGGPRVKFLATGGTIATFGGTRLTAEKVSLRRSRASRGSPGRSQSSSPTSPAPR